MAQEIERKFLVVGDAWREQAAGTAYRQGYLSTVKERTVRVRTAAGKGYLTVKGVAVGPTRPEFEYEIPISDANAMLDHLCQRPLIEKTRYQIRVGQLIWQVDEFAGENEGLVVAEVELGDEAQEFVRPDWAGEEVTNDRRYANANLVAHPYSSWSSNG